MEIDAQKLPWEAVHQILTGTIVPRPVGWISTIDAKGQPNLAPFSFFTAVCANPPHILFCPGIRSADGQMKDTLRNVIETGEFVVNIVTEELAGAMNLTSAEVPAAVDEFTVAHLITAPSAAVRPPRVAKSPIHFECQTTQIVEIGNQPGAGSVVIGKVLHIHVKDTLLIKDHEIDIASLKPIGRLAGSAYCRVNDVFYMVRPAPPATGAE